MASALIAVGTFLGATTPAAALTTGAIAVSATAAAVGTGVAVHGQIQAGKAEFRAEERNAAIQRQRAANERKAGLHRAGQIAEEGKRLRARQNVLFAAAGAGLAGTPLLAIQDTEKAVQEETRTTILGGIQRQGFFEAGAGLSLLRGRSARRASRTGAASTLLGGAGTLLGQLGELSFRSRTKTP